MVQVCDRCDGDHDTADCQCYSLEREKHPDALMRAHQDHVRDDVRSASARILSDSSVRYVRQQGDGSCLFHALAYGLHTNADRLRWMIAFFIGENPDYVLNGSPLSDWIKWDTDKSVKQYAKDMAWRGVWGGGIELAVCSHMVNQNINVYERACKSIGGYRLISAFRISGKTETLSICYAGRAHYDALVVDKLPTRRW